MAEATGLPFLPYGRQVIDDDDIAAVTEALRADFLTTGPRVAQFEAAFAETVGARHAVACSNGTAALHLAMMALDVGPNDAVIVPAITFAATANAARYQGAEVVFADVDPLTGLMTPATLDAALSRLERRPLAAVLPVHLGGGIVDLPAIRRLAEEQGAAVVEDACHALGATMTFDNRPERVGDGRHSAMACFSFHPVKTMTTGEGGMITTNDPDLAARMTLLRSHGITREEGDFELRSMAFDPADGAANPWFHEMQNLGFNYRLPDVNCALGLSQLAKLDRFIATRRALAARYRALLAPLAPMVRAVEARPGSDPALHLFIVLIDFAAAGLTRKTVMDRLKAKGIGTQVHYIPVPHQPYYRARYGEPDLPGADAYYARCLSLPLFAGMEMGDVERVAGALGEVLG